MIMNTQAAARITRSLACVALALASSACIARGPDDYRAVTRSLVDTKKADIEDCFGGTKGKVVVNFTVEKKTGKIMNPVVDEKASTASAEVGTCVASKIDGLGIEQPDMRDGAATFTWNYNK
jgi:hypothetical protein